MEEEIFMPCSPYAHFICDKRNRYMVGDSQGSDVPIHLLKETNEEENGEIKNDFIYLVDVEKREERKLCYHGTSWKAVHGKMCIRDSQYLDGRRKERGMRYVPGRSG